MPSLEDAQITFVIDIHECMKSYNEELMSNYRGEDEVTSNYLHNVCSLLKTAAQNVSDPEPYMDALLLVKCFSTTALLPSQRPAQMAVFLNWVQTIHQDTSQYTLRALDAQIESKDPGINVWKFIIQFVLTGQLCEAIELLESFEDVNDQNIKDLCALLAAYPLDSEKYLTFKLWRSDALAWRDSLEVNSSQHDIVSEFQLLADILAGHISIILNQSESWVSAVSGLFLYNDPSAEELPTHFKTAVNVNGLIPTWEEGCKMLFEEKVVAALGCLQLLDISSAVAISEFCNGRGLFADYSSVDGKVGGGVREELDLSYARMCLSEPALVEIGTEVLINLGSIAAKESAIAYLPQLVIRSSEYAEIAIEAAEQLELNELVLDLYRIAAKVNLADRKYVDAIKFFYGARDYQSVREASWKLFRETLVTKQLTSDKETAEILQASTNVRALDLESTVKDHLAPSAVLLALMEAIEAENIECILDNLHGLLTLPDPPLEYYPLLVALVSGVSGSVLELKTMALLMRALRLWDTASDETKKNSFELIAKASNEPAWQPLLMPEHDPKRFVWHLRRQLAKEVCL